MGDLACTAVVRSLMTGGWRAHVGAPNWPSGEPTTAEYMDNAPWMLFNLNEDFSEADDVAAKYPAKLEQLKQLWFMQASHVGYTHVGPNGAYHTGTTVAHGPGGTYGTSHTTASGSGGTAYHSTSSGAVSGTTGAAYGTHSNSGYYYAPSYSGSASGGAAYHSTSYGYVR